MPENVFGLQDAPSEDPLNLYPDPQAEEEETQETTSQQAEEMVSEGSPVESEEAAAPEETPEPTERPRDELGRFVKLEEGEEPPEGVEVIEVEVPDEEALEEEQPRLWANKYQTAEDLEQGYNESREQWRRAVEARKVEQQRAWELQQREEELARVIQESLPYLQEAARREEQFHRFAEQYKEAIGTYPEGYSGPPSGPAPLAPQDVNSIVEQRLAQERAQMQAQMQARQEYEATSASVMGFYQDHPEVEPRGSLDNGITDTMLALNEAWASRDEEVDMSDRGTIEVLYEASQRPALTQVLALKPEYFDSEAGLRLARREAALLEGVSDTEVVQTVPASRVGQTTGQKKPFAESAVTGAEVFEDEDDEWSQIKRSVQRGRDTSKSVFTFE